MENNFYKDKTVLVTGGAGSIGSEIVRRVLNCSPRAVRIFDNNETGLFNLDQELLSEKTRCLVGDVRDRKRLKKSTEGADVVFHAAALKHVPLCEFNPFEAIQTNVVGTQNVIDACMDNEVEKMINISTDKAVNPINVMGATKLLTEKLITNANYYRGKKKTSFSSVRFGNVLNSRGSVIPLFEEQIKKGGPVTITDPEMIRFVMSIRRAVDLVLMAAEAADGGEIFILKMPFLKMGDLADVMVQELAPKYGYNPKDIEQKIIGERIGEKFCEELMTGKEEKNICETEDMFIVLPEIKKYVVSQKHFLKKDVCTDGKENRFLDKKEIKELLREVLGSFEKTF
ncbi:MAG: SDR family NAD(P)-dependent oxidoreductase [Candidatus Paceibacterota bacterium]|jgi:FlaA1/EpsC-like NDP-sugar epimerase